MRVPLPAEWLCAALLLAVSCGASRRSWPIENPAAVPTEATEPLSSPTPELEWRPREETAAGWAEQGWAAVDREDLDAAVQAFEAALALEASNTAANTGLGYLLGAVMGDAEGALPHLCQASGDAGEDAALAKEALQVLGLTCDE